MFLNAKDGLVREDGLPCEDDGRSHEEDLSYGENRVSLNMEGCFP